MEKEKTIVETIIKKELVMPFNRPFIAFEDNEIILTVELRWTKPTTQVERVDFLLENKDILNTYKLHSLTRCENEKEAVFYRLTLVEAEEMPTFATLSASPNILGRLDLAKGEHMFIKFNCIEPNEVERYDENPCEFNMDKPRSKDGNIIVSI